MMSVEGTKRLALTALTTPFAGAAIDDAGLERSIDIQVAAGMDGLVILDVIGEGPTLDDQERARIIRTCLRHAGTRIRIIAVTGTCCTRTSVDRTKRAIDQGVGEVMATVPYYSKPQVSGVIDHFAQIAVCGAPVIVDDDPGRTAKDFGEALLRGLIPIENIYAVCHGLRRTGYFGSLAPDLKRRFVHISRDDEELSTIIRLGASGCLSGLANALPGEIRRLVDTQASQAEVDALRSPVQAIGRDDVAALKAAISLLHDAPADVRLPLVEADAETILAVQRAFAPFARCRQARHAAA
jgi:4-hydroxy-tetrahydrodipicolinate synthase